eukprot:INCI14524.2.p1 GENE.INCI14524.2~~INCI14524.2.p1  ORF type:complete len:331 (+),score=37.31 INCI14524.2:146-1138(+)
MAGVLLATAGYDHTIKLWEPRTAVCAKTLQFQGSQVNRLVISPNKELLLAAGNPQVKIFDIRSGNPNATFSYTGHSNNVTAIGMMPQRGSWIFSASEDKTIKIWDSSSKGFERDIKTKSPVTDAVLHPNEGEIVSSHRDGKIRVWDLGTAKCRREFAPDGKVSVASLSLSKSLKSLVAVTDSGKMFQYDPKENFELVNKVQAHGTYILRVKLSPDDRFIATTSADGTARLWLADGLEPHASLREHEKWVWDCDFSADSDYCITASSDSYARLWDVETGKLITVLKGHHKAVTCTAINDCHSVEQSTQQRHHRHHHHHSRHHDHGSRRGSQ